MNYGLVKHWNLSRGFGFITPENGDADVFVHVRQLEDTGSDYLEVGARVAFEVGPDGRNSGKTEARNVRVV